MRVCSAEYGKYAGHRFLELVKSYTSFAMSTHIDQFTKKRFSADTQDGHTISHDVYTRAHGPSVVIIQEFPGIGQSTLRLAGKLVDKGFEVVMPHLFGPIGKNQIGRNLLRAFCLRKEYSLFEKINPAQSLIG